MARSNYSRYEYETSPRKLEPYYAPKKKITEVKRETKQENKKKQKAHPDRICHWPNADSKTLLGCAFLYDFL